MTDQRVPIRHRICEHHGCTNLATHLIVWTAVDAPEDAVACDEHARRAKRRGTVPVYRVPEAKP